MPLIESGSKAAREENIGREIEAGKDPKQAAAIGYSVQRAHGGGDAAPSPIAEEKQEFRDAVVRVMPDGMSLDEIARRNREFWEGQFGDVDAAQAADKVKAQVS